MHPFVNPQAETFKLETYGLRGMNASLLYMV
jgi:hypothetical protein